MGTEKVNLISFLNFKRGYLICLIGTAIWSTTGILIRFLTENYHFPVVVLAFWRDFFVSVSLLFVFGLIARQRFFITSKTIPFFVFFGLILTGFNLLWTFSVALNGAAIATVLVYSSAVYTTILEKLFFKKNISWKKWIIVLLAFLGCFLVSGANNSITWKLNFMGIIVGFLSGIGFSLYSIMGKVSVNKSINTWTSLFYTFSFGAVFLFFLNIVLSRVGMFQNLSLINWDGNHFIAWFLLILLAIGPTIGGYGLYNLSLRYLNSSVANIIATLEPFFTALIAYFLLQEVFSYLQIFGGIVIIGCVMALNIIEDK